MAVSEARAAAERELSELKDAVARLHKDFEYRVRACEEKADGDVTPIQRHNYQLEGATWQRARFVTEKLLARHSIGSLIDQ